MSEAEIQACFSADDTSGMAFMAFGTSVPSSPGRCLEVAHFMTPSPRRPRDCRDDLIIYYYRLLQLMTTRPCLRSTWSNVHVVPVIFTSQLYLEALTLKFLPVVIAFFKVFINRN